MGHMTPSCIRLKPAPEVAVTLLEFGPGFADPDEFGAWTEGEEARLHLAGAFKRGVGIELGAEHQGPPGGGPVAAILHVEDAV